MRLLRVSISATEPARVAGFLATLMGGEALPFPPFPGSWIAFAAQDDGTAIEVHPTRHRLRIGPETIACAMGAPDDGPTFAHLSLRSALDRQSILDLGTAETWVTRICDRGPFDCVEIWLENRLLVEGLDPAMQRAYAQGLTVRTWRAMFGLD